MAKPAPDKRDGSDSKTSYGGKAKGRYWPGYVTRHSNALDLEPQVFASDSPRQIARSPKRSAETSKRRNGTLNFYINQAGKNISDRRKRILESAKGELRKSVRTGIGCGCGSPMSAAQAPGKVRSSTTVW